MAWALSEFAARYDGFIVDLDGCMWVGEEPIAGSSDAVAALREHGRRVVFATNDPRRSPEEYVRKLWRQGVRVAASDVVTVGQALERFLATEHPGRSAYVVGSDALRRHVRAAGLKDLEGRAGEHAELVVVGGSDDLVFEHLRVATLALHNGASLVATARDPVYPHPEGPWPGTGALVALFEYASGKRAQIVGKPERYLIDAARERLGAAERVLVIGDRLDSDIAAAVRAGLDGALVLSGTTSADEVRRHQSARSSGGGAPPRPVAVAENLAALVLAGGASDSRASAAGPGPGRK